MACEYCGQSAEAFGQLRDERDRLRDELALANQINGHNAIEIRRLKKEQAKDRTKDPRYEDACEVLRYWQDRLTPKAREPLSNKRLDVVFGRLGRLNKDNVIPHHDVAALKRCVDGYAAYPYQGEYGKRMTHGRPDQRKVEAEFIFRDDRHVLKGLAMADQADEHVEAFTASTANGLSEGGQRALRLAKMGWHVFPCQIDSKAPRPGSRGLLDAKTDEQAIRAFWTRVPEANLAVRTGAESGIVVLDVDGNEGYASLRELQRKYDDLPTTLSVVTPRGGNHFYFQHPGPAVKNTVGVPGPGLDIRGDGGYVLVPPSKVEGRHYEVDESTWPAPMPSWLTRLLVTYHERMAKHIEHGEWSKLMAECASEGQRNDTLTKIIGHLLGPLHMPSDEALVLAMKINGYYKPPLEAKVVQAMVVSLAGSEARKLAKG